MQRGVINLTMSEIQLLKNFAEVYPSLQATQILERIINWQPQQVTSGSCDVELTLEDAETVIDTMQSILQDRKEATELVEILLNKFNQFYIQKNSTSESSS